MVTGRVGRNANRRTRDSIVTIGTVLGLVAAMALTLFGLGAANQAVAGYDASSWLWSAAKSEVARANGLTGKVDTRHQIPNSAGHLMQVSQTDRYLILRDQNTGLVSALDLATLQISATMPTTAGIGVSVALHDDSVFVIDSVQGVVRQLDPLSLAPVGEPVRFPPGIAAGTFDGAGLLWIAVPTEGTVVAVRPAIRPNASSAAQGGGSGGAAMTPRQDRTVPVAEPNHELVLSALDSGVAVLDKTTNTMTTVRGDALFRVVLDLAGPGAMPARTAGPDVPVTVVEGSHVYVVNGNKVYDFQVPNRSPRLRPCVAWSGRFYCPDEATGKIYALSPTGQLLDTVTIENSGGPLDLEVRERHLFINAPLSSTARVVDEGHRVQVVDKYLNQILGGDPPKPPPVQQAPPAVGRPGAPRSVSASAGNASARVTWGPAPANNSAITKYVIEGGPKPMTVGANQRSVQVTGLTNGQTYKFSVYAVNAKGAGPKRTSNPVMPTADVPDPPASVTAKENPNGTVTISWPAANGLGRKIARYTVTAVSAGGTEEIGAATATSLTTEAGRLEYGTQYAFNVVAVNDKGAGSKPSPVSNSVVPYTKPGAVKGLKAATVNKKGTIQASWQVAEDNGRPITKYVVIADGRTQNVTGTSVELSGFADGKSVAVTVKAVNAAGEGPPANATAKTIAAPALTITAKSAAVNSINVTLSVTDNGSATTCSISINGGGPVGIGCGGGSVGGVFPGENYTFRVTASNAAGAATADGSVATPQLYGTVICPNNTKGYCNSGIWPYRTPTQEGTAASPALSVGTRFVAQCRAAGVAPDPDVNAVPYGGKNSSVWIRFAHGGTAYFPFAWTRLDNGDNLNQLRTC